MQLDMPRKTGTPKTVKHVRYVAADNDNVEAVIVRMPKSRRDAIAAAVDDINAKLSAGGVAPKWTRNELLNAVVEKWLRARKPGELP